MISMRSPGPAKKTVWSPTTSPPRATEKPIAPGLALAGVRRGARRRASRSSVRAARLRGDLAQLERRARGRVDLDACGGSRRPRRRSRGRARARRSRPASASRSRRCSCWAPSRWRSPSRRRGSRPAARASKPVVPITIARFAARHARRCASVPSGRVKSISTSAARERRGDVGADGDAARARTGRPRRGPPRLAATSSAAASVTPSVDVGGLEERAAHAAAGARDRRRGPRSFGGRRLRRRACGAAPARRAAAAARGAARVARRSDTSLSSLKKTVSRLRSSGLPPFDVAEVVVPAVGVEDVGQQRRAEQLLHLGLASCPTFSFVDQVLRSRSCPAARRSCRRRPQAETASAARARARKRMDGGGWRKRALYQCPCIAFRAMSDPQRTQGHRPQGDGAAPQGAGPVPAQRDAPPHRRGRLPQAPRGAFRHRARHRLSRAHAVRAGGAAGAPPLRERQGGLRAERGRPPRPPRVPAVRPRGGVLRFRDREAPEQGRARTAASRSTTTSSTSTPTASRRTARTGPKD